MTVKTSELKRAALNWAVAKCEGYKYIEYFKGDHMQIMVSNKKNQGHAFDPIGTYLNGWSQGGPIIEREKISVEIKHDGWWLAQIYNINDDPRWLVVANTTLIAAMRCYVASKMGDEVEIPGELL